MDRARPAPLFANLNSGTDRGAPASCASQVSLSVPQSYEEGCVTKQVRRTGFALKQQAPSRIARPPEVTELTGMSKTSLLRLAHQGLFPAPIKIGPRAIGWRLSDIEAYLAERPKADLSYIVEKKPAQEPLCLDESELGQFGLNEAQLEFLRRGDVIPVRRRYESRVTLIKLKTGAAISDRQGG